MSGIYGSKQYIVGEPSAPKPTREGQCSVCNVLCHREVFVSGQGWLWRHYGCDPVKPVIERRFTRGHNPLSYVPSNYERSTQFDPAIGAAIKRSRERG